MAAASSSFKENVGDTGDERRRGKSARRTRSSSVDTDDHDIEPMSPSAGRNSREQISRNTNNSSKSPSERRRRAVSRSTSGSKKEHVKDKAAQKRSKDESGSRSDPNATRGISYLSQKASEKKGSRGRKESVLGSLGTFLDEENTKPRTSGRSRDGQSVVSSASRRRRRSHTPSSASGVGGMSISREELRKQRRSSSAGPLDRKLREKRSSSRRSRDSSKEPRSKESSGRRRDPSREHTHRSRDTSKPSSSRKESIRSRARSSSVSVRGNHSNGSAPKTPTKSLSTGAKRRPSTEVVKAGVSSPSTMVDHLADKKGGKKSTEQIQTEQLHMSLSNGADVPPGFPLAAVDCSNRSSDDDAKIIDLGDNRNTPVLDSTVRLRERQAMSEGMTSVSNSPGALAKGGDKTRRSRRRSILGSMQAVEKNAIQAHPCQDPEERRKSLRTTKSEIIHSPSKRPMVEQQTSGSKRFGSVSPQLAKQLVADEMEIKGDLQPKLEAEDKLAFKQNGETRELETASPGPLKEYSHSEDKPKYDEKEKSEKGLWWNLSKVDKKKSSSTASTKKGSSKSVISAPALTGKISSVFGKARGRKSTTLSQVEIKTEHFDRLEASNASLDLNLLTESPSIQKVVSADELFYDAEDRGSSMPAQDDDIVSESSSDNEKFLTQTGVTPNGNATRVSWVELPLFNPEQLLMKSTDQDGANEISELSSHVRTIDEWKEESLKALSEHGGSKKTNPSLQATIGKDNEQRTKTGPQDERTVVTATTSSSDATTKTSNFVPSEKKPAQPNLKGKDLGASQDSLTFDQLDVSLPEDGGSSGSLSRSSRRSKGSKSSKSSKGSKENKGPSTSGSSGSLERTQNRHSSNSQVRSKERSKRKEDASSPKMRRRKSSLHGMVRDGNRQASKADSHSSKQRNDVETKEDKRDEGTLPLKKKPSLERTTSIRTREVEGTLPLKKKPSLERMASIRTREVGEMTPKKSYLNKRKHSKTDKAQSDQAKKAVNSSLDTFLERIEKAEPIAKDDLRSVHSSMQEKERKRRSRDRDKKKHEETIHSRRIKRFDPKKRSLENALKDLKGMDDDSEQDTDSMSITSAPLLRYKSSASSFKKLDSHRPVVDLKKTQFSSKLTKLHVAF